MNHAKDIPAYGLWSLVIINSAVFIIFAFSFFKPKTIRDWRTLGGFAAFIIALFVEMCGFPLTIYLIYPWLIQKFQASILSVMTSGTSGTRSLASKAIRISTQFIHRKQPFHSRRIPAPLSFVACAL